MKRTQAMKRTQPQIQSSPTLSTEDTDLPPVVQRPNGWYWRAEEGRREVGPFDTADEARAHWRGSSPIEPGETLAEAEAELNMSDWIDPATGAPAEDHVLHTGDE